jgi:predicted O-methyltransferase YrrM
MLIDDSATVEERSSDTLGAIEEALAAHRAFGDSDYIFEQLQACLRQRLENMAPRLPVAGTLLGALESAKSASLDHVLGDTVVRCAIIHGQVQLETDASYGLPIADCEKVFAATVNRLHQRKFGSTLDDDSLQRLGPEPYHGWIWSDEHAGDIFGRTFRYLLKHRYEAIPCTPSDGEIALLQQGATLLGDLLPSLAPSALRHAHVIAVVPSEGGWKGVNSSSQFHLGGTIFLGRDLHNAWWVAEHLLHESLHQKLYDFRQGHSLLEADFAVQDDVKIPSPWNSPRLNGANLWDVHRVFAAFHVYVHLALLATVAEQRAPELEDRYGPLEGVTERAQALERAHYLGEKLMGECWNHLGPAGQRMTEWLMAVLEFLNPSPPPKAARVHLCLDLYAREANQVAAALRKSESLPSTLPERLIPLAVAEVDDARRVLSAIDASQELDRFNHAIARYADSELGTNFPQIRKTIGTALTDAALDRYRISESDEHNELVGRMIENASRRLYSVLTGYPPAVADAKLRGTELGFRMSCQDEVGRLLGVLAGAVPPGARILEIGTGVGVGTAWITAGLGQRTDVEVVTVENDGNVSRAAAMWPWPSYVHIVTADALEILATLGTFDLVFADAAPVKYGHGESLVGALRPAGVLVIDDLRAGEKTTDEERTEKDALRRFLLHHPMLNAVDMAWASGVIVASRRQHSF